MPFHTSSTYYSGKIWYSESQQISIKMPIQSTPWSYYSWTFLSFLFFFLISIFFSPRIKWMLPGGIWICLKAIIITKCKRTLLRTLLFDDFLLFGLQSIWESLKTLAIYFFSLRLYVLYISIPKCKAQLLLFKSTTTNPSVHIFLAQAFLSIPVAEAIWPTNGERNCLLQSLEMNWFNFIWFMAFSKIYIQIHTYG